MGYWKSKVLPKIKKVFGPKKPEEPKVEETAAKDVVVEAGEAKEVEKVEEAATTAAAADETPAPTAVVATTEVAEEATKA